MPGNLTVDLTSTEKMSLRIQALSWVISLMDTPRLAMRRVSSAMPVSDANKRINHQYEIRRYECTEIILKTIEIVKITQSNRVSL